MTGEHDTFPMGPHPRARDYGIGALLWPGLGKLVEEMGEAAQAAGKIIATNGSDEHWDGGPTLTRRLEDELGDVLGAAIYLIVNNPALDRGRIDARAARKAQLFETWHAQVRESEKSEEK